MFFLFVAKINLTKLHLHLRQVFSYSLGNPNTLDLSKYENTTFQLYSKYINYLRATQLVIILYEILGTLKLLRKKYKIHM